MNAWEVIGEIARNILIMSVVGSTVALALILIKPLIKDRLPKSVQYYMWVLVLASFLVPFSAFISVPVNTPIAPVQKLIRANVKTTAEWQEEVAEERYNMPYEKLAAHEQVDVTFGELGGMKSEFNNYLLISLVFTGAFVFSIEFAQYFVYTIKLRRRRLAANDDEAALLERLCGYDISVSPRLYRNPLVPTPMLIGVFRPTIYLPDIEYTEQQLRNIMLHELTHLRRNDIIIKWIAALAVHVHWFNPLAYFARREIDRACELACDETVVKSLDRDGKQSYGNTLIAMAADIKHSKLIASTTMCEEKKTLKERLSAIMRSKKFSAVAIAVSCALFISVLLGAVALGAESVDKVTAPVVSIYGTSGRGTVLLTADVNTGIISLPAVAVIQAVYRDNMGESSIRTCFAPIESAESPKFLSGVGRYSWGASDVKSTGPWDVASEYPEGFDGYVWAVATDSKGAEKSSEYLRVLYDPANTPTMTELILPVTLYTYSGDTSDILGEELPADESGRVSLPDTVVIGMEVPDSVAEYELYCVPEGGEALLLRAVSAHSSNVNRAVDISSPDHAVWVVRDYFPGGFSGEIYAVAAAYESTVTSVEPVRVLYDPDSAG